MKMLLLSLIALLWTAPAIAQSGSDASPVAVSNSDTLIKMTTGISTATSKPGDPITGEIIDPPSFRGATLKGRVDRADHSILQFSIRSITIDGKTYPVDSKLTSIVNSKGIEGMDDLGQRIRIDGGGIIAYGTSSALDEGAEVHMSIWRK